MYIQSNESISSYNVAANLIVLVAIGQVPFAAFINISLLNLTSSRSIKSDTADSQPILSSSWWLLLIVLLVFLPNALHISSHTVPFSTKADKPLGYIRAIPTTCKRPSWTRIRFRFANDHRIIRIVVLIYT